MPTFQGFQIVRLPVTAKKARQRLPFPNGQNGEIGTKSRKKSYNTAPNLQNGINPEKGRQIKKGGKRVSPVGQFSERRPTTASMHTITENEGGKRQMIFSCALIRNRLGALPYRRQGTRNVTRPHCTVVGSLRALLRACGIASWSRPLLILPPHHGRMSTLQNPTSGRSVVGSAQNLQLNYPVLSALCISSFFNQSYLNAIWDAL